MKETLKKLITVGHAGQMRDPEFDELKQQIFSKKIVLPEINYANFGNTVENWFTHNSKNSLHGFENFHRYVCTGVTAFIDSLLIQHRIDNLQILEHDYTYYRRLYPHKKWSVVGNLTPKIPMILSMPFSGYGDIHPRMNDILDECNEKNIPLFLDAAWLSSAKNIEFDFSHSSIQGFSMSLSKGLGLEWNRVGVAYFRNVEENNNINIFNKFDMVNSIDLSVGKVFMDNFSQSYLWDKYQHSYDYICKTLLLKPTKCIHMATYFNKGTPIGIRNALVEVYNNAT